MREMVRSLKNIKNYVKVNKTCVLFFFLMLPFFQPGCIDNMIAYGMHTALFESIGLVYAVARMGVSVFAVIAYIYMLMHKNIKINRYSAVFMLCTVCVIFSNLWNQAGLSVIISNVCEIAFLCLCELLLMQKNSQFVYVLTAIFGILSIVGAISIFAFPQGLNHAPDIHVAIYFLGSKNASVNLYIVFLMGFAGIACASKKKLPISGLLWILIFLATGIITESGSAILCMGLLLVWYLLYRIVKKEIVISPWIPFLIVACVLVLIYSGTTVPVFSNVLAGLGRDITFSGRVPLWQQALDYFKKFPLLGTGIDVEFRNLSGYIQQSAHSQYLDRLAKYGIAAFVCFMAEIIFAVRDLQKAKRKKLAGFLGGIFAVYLLRMGFDTYSFYYFIVLVYLIPELIRYAAGGQEGSLRG